MITSTILNTKKLVSRGTKKVYRFSKTILYFFGDNVMPGSRLSDGLSVGDSLRLKFLKIPVKNVNMHDRASTSP
jgi:hypothetical protein